MPNSSSSSSSKEVALRCPSGIVVTNAASSASASIEHLSDHPIPTLFVSRSGIMAGPKWTIRHGELDYAAFLAANARHLHLPAEDDGDDDEYNDGSDYGGGNEEFIVQSRPNSAIGHRTFVARRPSSSAASSRDASIAQFAGAVVKFHDRWRSKHPGEAPRLNGHAVNMARAVLEGAGRSGVGPKKRPSPNGGGGAKRAVSRRATAIGRRSGLRARDPNAADGGGDDDAAAADAVDAVDAGDGAALLGHRRSLLPGSLKQGQGAGVQQQPQPQPQQLRSRKRKAPAAAASSTEADVPRGHGERKEEPERKGTAATAATTATATTTTTNTDGDAKAKTVTPTPTASAAARKEQQSQQQSRGQQGMLTSFFGAAGVNPRARGEDEKAAGDDVNEEGSEKEDAQNKDEGGIAAASDDGNDSIIDKTTTTATRLNRRRKAYGSSGRRPASAASQASRGCVDQGLVGPGPGLLPPARSPARTNGGGIGPPAAKTNTSRSTASTSINEDPFTFADDGQPTPPISYNLPAGSVASRMTMGSPSPSSRRLSSRSFSPSKSPGRRRQGQGQQGGAGLFLPAKSPRNATPSRRNLGGRRTLGGKELLAQRARAGDDSDDEYVRASRMAAGKEGGDDDSITTACGDGTAPLSSPSDARKTYAIFNTKGGAALTMPSTPTKTHSARDPSTPSSNVAAIMPGSGGRAPSRSRSRSSTGTPSWGASLAKKGGSVVREAPYDNLEEDSPDSPVAVRNLDDRFGRCREPPSQDLCDTDDEEDTNPYRRPNEARDHYRGRLENDRKSKYFGKEAMSVADSALNPMMGGRGRGQTPHKRLRKAGESFACDRTPPRRNNRLSHSGYAGNTNRDRWSPMGRGSNNQQGFFGRNSGRRNASGIDRAAERAKNNVATGLRNLGNTW